MVTSWSTTIWSEVNGTSDTAKLTVIDDQPQQMIIDVSGQQIKLGRADLANAMSAFDSRIAAPQALKAEDATIEPAALAADAEPMPTTTRRK